MAILKRMRVLIAPDKFKGTLTASEAAGAIAGGWRKVRPADELELLPISDGGDGFGEVLAGFRRAALVRTVCVDAAGRRCIVPWWWDSANRTAIIESARVIGLAMLPPGKFHPFALDTHGLAAVLRAAARRGAMRCVVGIGGSATNDGGFGLARGLGWSFFNRQGKEIKRWTGLAMLDRIVRPRGRCWPRDMIVAVDVRNRLLGTRGCTRIYGPQKGLRPGDFSRAEACLRRLALVARRTFGSDFAAKPGAGAAGGLGFGLAAFTGARLKPGFDLVAREAGLSVKLRRADLVVTGEGRLDGSSLMGKGVGEMATRCRKLDVPCVALGGAIANRGLVGRKFFVIGALTDLTSRTRAQADATLWLGRLAESIARKFSSKEA
jgi:glycerate kinase